MAISLDPLEHLAIIIAVFGVISSLIALEWAIRKAWISCTVALLRVKVAGLTLVVDEDVLRHARVRALQQGTSVNALVYAYLARIAGESEASQEMEEFFTAVTGSGAGSGGRTWTRDELHDRR